mmetsp:Transcript_27271/g.53309  ORF Transcript_27271/g.53309 Transcript_27271/m.53309 type:complete len:376 (+) Transcript_27271:56-1183(+)
MDRRGVGLHTRANSCGVRPSCNYDNERRNRQYGGRDKERRQEERKQQAALKAKLKGNDCNSEDAPARNNCGRSCRGTDSSSSQQHCQEDMSAEQQESVCHGASSCSKRMLASDEPCFSSEAAANQDWKSWDNEAERSNFGGESHSDCKTKNGPEQDMHLHLDGHSGEAQLQVSSNRPSSSSSSSSSSFVCPTRDICQNSKRRSKLEIVKFSFNAVEFGPEYLLLVPGDIIERIGPEVGGWLLGQRRWRCCHISGSVDLMEEPAGPKGWYPCGFTELIDAALICGDANPTVTAGGAETPFWNSESMPTCNSTGPALQQGVATDASNAAGVEGDYKVLKQDQHPQDSTQQLHASTLSEQPTHPKCKTVSERCTRFWV